MANSGDAEPAAAVSPDAGAPVHAADAAPDETPAIPAPNPAPAPAVGEWPAPVPPPPAALPPGYPALGAQDAGPPPNYGWPPNYGPAAGWGTAPPGPYGPLGVALWPAAVPAGPSFEPRDEPFLDVPGAPPVTKGDGWMWLLFGVIGFVVGQVAAVIFVFASAAVEGKTSEVAQLGKLTVPPEWYIVSSLLGIWVGFFGAAWLSSAVRGTRRLVADLGIRFRWIDLVGIVIGIGGQFLVDALYAPFQRYLHNYNAPTTKLTGGAHGWGFALIAVFTILGAPFFEELFFRGVVFKALARLFTPRAATRGLARTLGVIAAVVADGLIFGLAHAELQQLAGLALFGMVLAAISYRTGRLGMNMVSHASFNLVAIIEVLRTGSGVIH